MPLPNSVCALIVATVVMAAPAVAAGRTRDIAYLDIEDPYSTQRPFADCLERLGVAGERLKPSGSFVPSGTRVLLIGSFATGNSKGRRFIRDNARRIRDFVLGGGVVVEFGQSRTDESSPPWLPTPLVAERSDRDCRRAVALDPDHPLLRGASAVDLGALMAGEVYRGHRYYAPSIVGGTDLFGKAEGFSAVVAEGDGGEFPLVLAGKAGKGGVILLAMSPDLLCSSGAPDEARAAGESMMRNILSLAARGRLSDGGRPARSVQPGPVRHLVSVFHDRDGNGVREAGEEGLADVVVTYDFSDAKTDARGEAAVEVDPWAPGLLFIRVPDGWQEAGSWYADASGTGPHVFGLHRQPFQPAQETVIVQLSDTHLGRINLEEDRTVLASFVSELTCRHGPGVLFAGTGDLTHTGSLTELEAFRSAFAVGGNPKMPVMGNHDWGNGPDTGRLYREVLGPTHYAREWQGRLLVSIPRLETHARAKRWLAQTLADSRLPVVLLLHYFPTREAFDRLQRDRVVAVLSGHWHGDMVTTRNGVVSINSPPALMGGWDFSPGSARVIHLDSGGVVRAELVPLVRPTGRSGADGPGTEFSNDGVSGPASASGVGGSEDGPPGTERPPVGGGLEALWSTNVPGKVLLASPVLAGSRVLVPFRSTGTVGGDGGLCALERSSGATEWCLSTPAGATNDLVVSGRTVVLAQVDGTIQGIALEDGTVSWQTRLDATVGARYVEHYLHSGAFLHKGVAYYCYQGGPFGVEVATGRVSWHGEPFGGLDAFSHSRGVVLDDHLFCGAFLGGVFRYRLGRGGVARRERLVKGNVTADLSLHGNLSVLTREALLSLDPLSGKVDSKVRVEYSVLPAAVAWGDFGPFIPDGDDGLRRLGKRNGGRAWKVSLRPGPLSFALNLRDSAGLVGSPVATGRTVLVPGTDGFLRVVSASDGRELERFDAGSPLVSTPSVRSGTVYVAGYSGRVFAVSLVTKR